MRLRPALASLLLLAACGGDARELAPFTWSGDVPAGEWVRVRNLNGPVRVAAAAGSEVRVTGRKRYDGRRPEAVRFVVEREGRGVVVCAVWGDGGCEAQGRRSGTRWWERLLFGRSPVSAELVVALPAGVRIDAETVNGSVTVADAAGEVRARSVNGAVNVDARGGPVAAVTVNGSVRARLASLAPGARATLESVNGSLVALVPPTMAATVDLATTNGSVSSDLPLAVERSDRRHLRGTVGAPAADAPTITLKTVNGRASLGVAPEAPGPGERVGQLTRP